MSGNTAVQILQEIIGKGARAATSGPALSLDDLVDAVAESIGRQQLTLFLGAGLSYATGFPTWPALLSALSDALVPAAERAAFDQLSTYDSPLIIARYLKSRLNVGATFHRGVREALYAGSPDYTRPNPTLDLVVAIVELAHRRGTRLDLITYNFDDLLERTLEARLPAARVASIASEVAFHRANEAIRIFHVHGFISPDPSAQPVLPPPPLVLSEDDFHALMNNPAAWQNQIQVAALGFRDCLFIGMSMTDPNLRRVLDFATGSSRNNGLGQRWIVTRRYGPGDTLAPGSAPMDATTAATINGIKADLFGSLGATGAYLSDFSDYAVLTASIRAKF